MVLGRKDGPKILLRNKSGSSADDIWGHEFKMKSGDSSIFFKKLEKEMKKARKEIDRMESRPEGVRVEGY